MKKFWIAIGEHELFSKNDHYIFQALFSGQSAGKGWNLTPKFVESSDLEEARSSLHAFVDERIDHELHMMDVDKSADTRKQHREAFAARPVVPDGDINSLEIGKFVGGKHEEKISTTDGFLDLESLL